MTVPDRVRAPTYCDANVCRPPVYTRIPGQDFPIVAISEHEPAVGGNPRDHRGILRIDRAVPDFAAWTHVVVVLLTLQPELRAREQIRAVQMIPVDVSDDDVGDLIGLDPEPGLQGVAGPHVVDRLPLRHELVAIEPRIDEDDALGRSQDPDHHRDVEPARGIRVGDERRHTKGGKCREPDGVDLVERCLFDPRDGHEPEQTEAERDEPQE